jgi:trigger factor
MAVDVSTTTTELPESRVRVQAEVAPTEVEKRVAQAAKQLGRNLRVPGFRAGKAPAPVVMKRLGREAVLDEAVRDSIGLWYSAALDAARIVPIGEPAVDISDLPAEGEPLRFSIEIGVRPKAQLGDYKGLEVGRHDAEVDDAAVDAEVDRLRERTARLETVERAAASGDFLVMDYRGTLDGEAFAGGEARDQMIELGSGRLVPGFEEQLTGATAGDERTITITFPGDYGAAELAGREAEFAVTVNEVKEKRLPELDDDFAVDAGFDTVDELRADIRDRLAKAEEARLDSAFRQAVLDSAVAAATIEVPDSLIEARARELWDSMLHQLSHQGINREMYLQISGREEDEVIEQGKPEAELELKREAVLAAVVEAEGISPSEDELLEALAQSAEHENTTPKKLMQRLESAGRLDSLKADLSHRRALELLVEHAKPIPVEQAQAREKLWTPGKDEPAEQGSGAELWTPGS